MRLIDADALKKKWQDVLDAKPDEKDTVAYLTFELFIDSLKEEPTVDAVEVVRCRDCKHYGTSGCAMDAFSFDVTEESFCSYGERRDTDEH